MDVVWVIVALKQVNVELAWMDVDFVNVYVALMVDEVALD